MPGKRGDNPMIYTVTAHRIVLPNSAGVSFRTGKIVTTPNANAGKHSVAVRLDDGRMAWGFADCAEDAEAAAILAAMEISA
jgi:hypothetical protein